MILDIRYHDRAPEQIQRVRLTTVYTNQQSTASPQLVIHFDAPKYGQANINLSEIYSITVTND